MLCSGCSKLFFNYTNKQCVSCKGLITLTISVICDNCSIRNSQCSACLKKILEKKKSLGCNCGR